VAEEIRADLLLGRDTMSPGLLKASRAAADASKNIHQLSRDLYEVNRQRATPIVKLDDADATVKLQALQARLLELSRRAAEAQVDVNDKDAAAKLTALTLRLDQVGKKLVSPRITLEGADRAEAEIFALDAQLDRLTAKSAEAKTATSALAGAGGKLPVTSVAAIAGQPPFRMAGYLAQLGRLLNVDGYPVIAVIDEGRTAALNAALLREQFVGSGG